MAAADDDFDDLMDDIDFDMGGPAKKGKPGNVVFSTGLDTAKGIKEALNPLDKIPELIREMMPNAVRSEYSDLESALSEVKDEMEKGMEDIKSTLKDVSRSVSDLFPEGSIKNKLKEFGQKEGSGDYQPKTKEEEERDKINQALLEALGEASDEEKQRSLVQEAVAEKREATSQMMLKHIYGELKVNNGFNARMTDKFYRKSLELQYKQLYKTAELVEITKAGWELNRKQIESILINTSLPDIIKLKTLQAANDPRLRERAKTSYLGTYFKRFNPFENLKNNLIRNIKQQVSDTKGALEMALMGADSIKMAKEMMGDSDMGMTPGMMLGNWLGGAIRGSTLGKLGERLSQTKQGKRAVWNFKNFMADPRDFLQDMAGRADGKTAFGKLQKSALTWLGRMAGSPDKKRVDYVNENLDDAKAFDGRVHQAIVKVIPGLLTDIRSTLKAGLKVSDEDIEANRIYFDNKTGTFMSGQKLTASLNKDLATSINKDGFKMYAESLFNLLDGNLPPDKQLSNKDKQDAAKILASFFMKNGGAVSANVLTKPELLKLMPKRVQLAMSSLAVSAYNNYYTQEDVKNALEGMRSSLPNMNKRLQDLHKSGYMNIAGGMGLVTQDARTGNWQTNQEATDTKIANAVGNINFGESAFEGQYSRLNLSGAENKLNEIKGYLNDGKAFLGKSRVGRSILNFGSKLSNSRIANRFKNAGKSINERFGLTDKVEKAKKWSNDVQDNLVAFLDQDTEAIKDQLVAKKVKAESFFAMDNLKQYSADAKKKLTTKFNQAQDTVSKTVKDFRTKAKNLTKEDIKNFGKEAKEKALTYYKQAEVEIAKISKDFVDDARDLGLTEERIEEFKDRVEKIKRDTETRIKNDPYIQAGAKQVKAGGEYIANTAAGQYAKKMGTAAMTKFMESKAGKKLSSWKEGLKSKASGMFGGLFGGAKEAGASDKSLSEVEDTGSAGTKRAKEAKKRKEEDEALRENSAGNLNKKRKALADQDKGRKRSGFTTLAGAKVIAAGGLGLLAISLLKKLGFGMEDFINIGKGIVSTLSTVGGLVMDGISAIGKVLGWIAAPIKWIANKFGFTGGEDGPDTGGSGLGSKALGTAIAGGLLYMGGKALWNNPFVRAGRWLTKGAIKLMVPNPKSLVGPRAIKGLKTAGSLAAKTAGFAARTALKAPRVALAGARLAGAAAFGNAGSMVNAAKGVVTAVKAPTPGSNLFTRLITWIKDGIGFIGRPVVALLEKAKDKVIKGLDKVASMWNTAKSKFKFLSKVITKPKVLKKVGPKVATKLASRLASLAAAATGIGAIITVGFAVWDVAWILKYTFIDDMPFWSAVSKQMLGIDLFNPEEQKALEVDEDSIAREEENKLKEEELKKTEASMKDKIKDNSGGSNLPNPNNNGFSTGYLTNPYANSLSATTAIDKYNANNYFRPKPTSNYTPPKNFKYNGIGSVSSWFESRSRPGTISSGRGDHGGVSYGSYQFIGSTLKSYLKTSKYKNEFNGLNIYTPEFNAKWVEVASRDPEGFQKDQDEYIKKSHYAPCASKLRSIGLYVEGRSDALKAAVFSTAVSMGPDRAFNVISAALKAFGVSPVSGSDEEIIKAIYDYKAMHVDSHYKSSSYNVREGRRKRAIQEKDMVLSILNSQPQSPLSSGATPNTGATVDNTTNKVPASTTTSGSTTFGSDTELGPIRRASFETTRNQDGSSVTTISTTTNTGIGNMVILMKQQLDVQTKMNENLLKIVANTAIFGEYAKSQSSASTPTEMPQPVISLERRESFTNI